MDFFMSHKANPVLKKRVRIACQEKNIYKYMNNNRYINF